MPMLPVTYCYARVSKDDGDARNLDTQLRLLVDHAIHPELVFSEVASGRPMNRLGGRELVSRPQPGDTIDIAFLDRFSRHFEEGVRIQAELTERDIGIVAIREHLHQRRQRRGQVLPPVDAGSRDQPGRARSESASASARRDPGGNCWAARQI